MDLSTIQNAHKSLMIKQTLKKQMPKSNSRKVFGTADIRQNNIKHGKVNLEHKNMSFIHQVSGKEFIPNKFPVSFVEQSPPMSKISLELPESNTFLPYMRTSLPPPQKLKLKYTKE